VLLFMMSIAFTTTWPDPRLIFTVIRPHTGSTVLTRQHAIQSLSPELLSVCRGPQCGAGSAWAVDPFKVRDIRVEGLQRVEAGTIFASLPVRVGDTYDDEKGAAAIQALFGLGLFKDVRIEVSGDVLVVIVEERPTVADVEFSGNKEFDKDLLRKSMRDAGLTDGGRSTRRCSTAPSRSSSASTSTAACMRRGRHHRHADRAQPRQSDLHDHRG
jgi:hypothetical protein